MACEKVVDTALFAIRFYASHASHFLLASLLSLPSFQNACYFLGLSLRKEGCKLCAISTSSQFIISLPNGNFMTPLTFWRGIPSLSLTVRWMFRAPRAASWWAHSHQGARSNEPQVGRRIWNGNFGTVPNSRRCLMLQKTIEKFRKSNFKFDWNFVFLFEKNPTFHRKSSLEQSSSSCQHILWACAWRNRTPAMVFSVATRLDW